MSRAIVIFVLAILAVTPAFSGDLHQSIKRADYDETANILKQGADTGKLGANGESALTQAILLQQTQIVSLLFKHGALPDVGNAGGFLPLHAAAYVGNAEIAKLTLDQGVDINNQTNRAGVTPISIASEENRLEVAQLLLKHGANFELADKNGYTPLTRAIWRGHSEMITLLQNAGAKCQPVEVLEEPAFTNCKKGEK